MSTSSMEELGIVIATNVKALVSGVEKRVTSALAALTKRLDELPTPRDGRDGKDAEAVKPEEVAAALLPSLEKRCEELVAKLPPAAKGEPGQDGKDGQPGEKGEPGSSVSADQVADALRPDLEAFAKAAVDAIPRPADGRDADPSAVVDALRPVVDEVIKAAVAALPPPAAGRDGADGAPADPEAVAELLLPDVKAHLDAAIAALPPAPAGRDGIDGKSIDPAEVQQMVKAAVAELPKPEDGREGRDGPPGRDAMQIDVLPAIDETRSYPRATYAGHKGGLWRSHKTTDGLVGWECIVTGIDRVEVRQNPDDPREFVVETMLSTGAVVAKTITIPAVIDCGVYREGTAHRKGDGVTWARHYWIARRDTKEKPDVGDDWRLAVKSGRDGKDGKDGDRGPAGPRGEPGRNPGDPR